MGRKVRLSTQILASQLTILVITMLIGLGLYARALRQHLDQQYEQRALAIAQAVAAMPEVRDLMGNGDPGGSVASLAEAVRQGSGASYVVVIDRDGMRHSHPNPALIGQKIEEPVVALDGRSHVGINEGSLGRSANGKAPLRGPSNDVIGEVSVGILEREVSGRLWSALPGLALYTALALGVGALASMLLARRLKHTTFGLELAEIARLFQEREAMLHGVREGVVTVDPRGRVTLINDEARRLLEIGTTTVGERIDALLPPGRLRDVLSGAVSGPDQVVLTDKYCLVVNRMPVRLQGRDLGAAITLRDRTELEGLLRELDSVRGLTDALRAQQHDFANHLHVISGLLELGRYEEAAAYAHETSGAAEGLAESLQERIASPPVAAILLAKATIAAERGVKLEVTRDSWLEEPPGEVQALLTVLGNLIDNAIDATAGRSPATVTVHLLGGGGKLVLQVSDTGPGLPPGDVERVFSDGFTTKASRDGPHRGLGLALVHRLVQRLGGTITVGDGPGATFTVVLPERRPAAEGAAR